MGYQALYASTTGAENTGLGRKALTAVTTGGLNTAVGRDAGFAITTGDKNTCIGRSAGNTTTTGENNSTLGFNAQPSSAGADNEVTLGDANISSLRCADTSISSLSDRRDKTDIVDLPVGLDFINSVRPVKFKWQTREGTPAKDGKIRAGFIAQELQEAQSGSEYLNLVMDENPEKLEAKQGKLIPVLVKAIQELSAEVQQLKAQINN